MKVEARRTGQGAVGRLAALLLAGVLLVPGAAIAQVSAPVPPSPASTTAAPAADTSSDILPAARALRISVHTPSLATEGAGPTTVSVVTNAGTVPGKATFALRQAPDNVTMDFDLPGGIIRVGDQRVGSFPPIAPLTDNLKFPVDIAIRRGNATITAHREITLLLPTVIVPGFSNERRRGPDPLVLKGFARYGYTQAAPTTLFWFAYDSHAVGLEQGARALAAYVRRTVLPATYAAKINVVGYSVGGLFPRWNVAYDVDGWNGLVNRLVMVAVPNEGAVMPYVGAHVPPFLPFAVSAKAPLARAIEPVFPFWRARAGDPWSFPPDGGNAVLAALNARPIPPAIRLYILYGNNDPGRTGGPQTASGVTGVLPGATLSYAAGDGIVLTASTLGLPINGYPGVPALAERAVRVDVGRVYHVHVLQVGAAKVAALLQDRFETSAEAARTPQQATH